METQKSTKRGFIREKVHNSVYKPREDSYLILDQIRKYARGNVLDMGTGTGILAINASSKADFVYGTDINQKAINYAKKSSEGIKNIKFIKSDLFNYFKKNPETFDLIIFNPPYLPEEKYEPKESALATTGGKKGYELLNKFLKQSSKYLKPDGKILILFSTLTNTKKVHEIIEDYGFNYHKLAEQSFFFETLFVYLLEKSDFLIELEDEGITDIEKLTKGHRGIIYTGKLNKTKVAVKTKNPESKAMGRIYNEARWLRLLNKYSIGPKIIMHDKDYFIYKFAKGMFFPEFIEKNNKTKIKQIIKEIFNQCFKLDQLKINKEEMHHPYKHIIIDKKPILIDARKSKISGIHKTTKVVLLDFERTHKTLKPQNVTQFCQYITSGNLAKILKSKGFRISKAKIVNLAGKYKKNMTKINLDKITGSIQ